MIKFIILFYIFKIVIKLDLKIKTSYGKPFKIKNE